MERETREIDRAFILVTAAVFIGLTAATVAAELAAGLEGVVFFFVAWVVAVSVWARVVREWLNERSRLSSVSRDVEAMLLEEVRRLRESIEALRKSLES